MRAKFGVLEQTHCLHLQAKFHLNVLIVSAPVAKNHNFGQILTFLVASVPTPFNRWGPNLVSYSRPMVHVYLQNFISIGLFCRPVAEKNPNFCCFFGPKSKKQQKLGVFGVSDVANCHQSQKVEHGCTTTNLPLSTGIKIVSVLQRLHSEIWRHPSSWIKLINIQNFNGLWGAKKAISVTVPNIVVIGQTFAETWRYSIFFNMAAVRHWCTLVWTIDEEYLVVFIIAQNLVGMYAVVGIPCKFVHLRVWLENTYIYNPFWSFLGVWHVKWGNVNKTHKRYVVAWKDAITYRSSKSVNRCDLCVCVTNRPEKGRLDGCIVWSAHNTVLGEEALLIYIVPACYVKNGKT